jgi:formyl-CoA transferase
MRLSRTPVRQDSAGPQLGSGTRAALEWAGLPTAAVDRLLASGVATDVAHADASAPPAVLPPPADD